MSAGMPSLKISRLYTMKILNAALRAAAAHDHAALAAGLVTLGANPYDTDEAGCTAFNRAASNGLSALAVLTKIAFADTQKPPSRRRWKQYDLNSPSGAYGSTLITYAAKVCDAGIIKAMIKAGADLRIVNGSGWSLLHCAAAMPARAEVLKLLLQSFHDQGHNDLINARTTHAYETAYNGHQVIYAAELTAADLCRARLDQDPSCPRELAQYLEVFIRQRDYA